MACIEHAEWKRENKGDKEQNDDDGDENESLSGIDVMYDATRYKKEKEEELERFVCLRIRSATDKHFLYNHCERKQFDHV